MARLTQKDMVLDYMERFGSITSMDAFNDLGITRLSSVIFDLRRAGYKIKSTDETRKNRYEVPITYARYSLEKTPVQMGLF